MFPFPVVGSPEMIIQPPDPAGKGNVEFCRNGCRASLLLGNLLARPLMSFDEQLG
jgi:hypothetical protein